MKILGLSPPIKLRLPIAYSFFQFLPMSVDEAGDICSALRFLVVDDFLVSSDKF